MKNYIFATGNMKKPQEFTLYPYTGGDTIILQSDKRFIRANLRTGDAFINASNRNYANSVWLSAEPLKCKIPADIITQIQADLWQNNGQQGNISGVVFYDNDELFSKESIK